MLYTTIDEFKRTHSLMYICRQLHTKMKYFTKIKKNYGILQSIFEIEILNLIYFLNIFLMYMQITLKSTRI
jgi:hypothetical protein